LKYTSDQIRPTSGHNSDPATLPCLNSNISTEITSQTHESFLDIKHISAETGLAKLSTQHRKSAFVLKESVQLLSSKYGLEHLGFLTLTFRDHILSPKEAQRRLNSLLTHIIKPRYRDYLGVMERQKSGRIHYHLLVVLPSDIRTGFDFDQVQSNNYTSASPGLRSEWSFWRKTAPSYGFGRTELLPIKSSTEAIAKYVGKYISKHMECRQLDDKGVRLVRYSRGARAGTTRFQFHSHGSAEWRRKLAIFAQIVQSRYPTQKVSELSDLSKVLGKRWAYKHRDFILSLP
jgi:hypothetical protein